jgi:hypothetical protein
VLTDNASLFALARPRYVASMDPKPPGSGYLLAPGASGPSLRLPGSRDQESMPGIDDHIVREETREEMVRGRRVIAAPAKPPHADQHNEVGYVIRGLLAPGYKASSDLLTRVGPSSDFATDTCVRRIGVDPATNTRYLEELAFEVVSEQSLHDITERAEDLSNRGVRRLIAIFVKKKEVAEWSAENQRWIPLPLDAKLEDPTLARPLLVRALFDAAVADNEVIAAQVAKGNPLLAEIKAEALAMGRAEGLAEGITKGRIEGITALCEALDIPIGASERSQMHALDAAGLEALLTDIKTNRRWPTTCG